MISLNEYQFIIERISSAFEQGDSMAETIVSVRDTLDANDLIDGDLDKRQFRSVVTSTYLLIARNHQSVTTSFADFVQSLHEHIEHHYKTTINDFLTDNKIKVTHHFSVVSSVAGYPIDDKNIE